MEVFLTVSLGLATSLFLLCMLLRRRRRDGEPPLIQGWIPILGKALEFRKDSYQFLQQMRRKHGDVFTVLIAGKYITFVMDPLLYPDVIKHGKQLDFHKFSDRASSATFGYQATGTGKFPGLTDKIQRSFLLLQGSALNPLTLKMVDNLQQVLRRHVLSDPLTDWREADLYGFCMSVMFEATFLTLYGRPPYAQQDEWVDALRSDFTQFDAMFPLLIASFPISLLRKTKAVQEKMIDFFHPKRMAEWSGPSAYIQTRMDMFQEYDTLTDVDKGAHHFAMLWASVGNTIPACFWCLYHLLSDPRAFEVVRTEILDVTGRDEAESIHSQDVKLTREQLEKMVYLDSAINESLRLSSASMNIRVVQEDFCLHLSSYGSAHVRMGDIVALYPQSTHMDPDIYPSPEQYQFGRFVEDGKKKSNFYKGGQKVRYHHMPFGSGSSMCPGRFFAINEVKQFVCITLLMCDVQLTDCEQRVRLDKRRAGLGILPPANRVSFRYSVRRNKSK